MAWNLTCWCILTIFKTDYILVISWFPSFWLHFDLVKQVKFATNGHFVESAREEWTEIWHAGVSWLPSELIRFWSQSVDFSHLASFGLKETGHIWCFWWFKKRKRETQERNGLKFDMRIYADHIVNWLRFGHGPLIFLILAVFQLSKTSQITVSGLFLRNAGINGLKCAMMMYPDHLLHFLIFIHAPLAMWVCANLIGLCQLSGATVIRSLVLLVPL